MTEEWLTQEEAAGRLHVALDTMRRWVREGLFPRTKVGKRYLIPAKALEDFLQSRLQTGARPITPRKTNEVRYEVQLPKERITSVPGGKIPLGALRKSKTAKPSKVLK